MIHKEGYPTLIISFIALTLLCIVVRMTVPFLSDAMLILAGGLYVFLLSFFRNPQRIIPQKSDDILYAPADGKIVVNENTVESGYLNKKARMVSIFMSPLNVHVNRHPINGTILHSEHHEGKFLPAWDPKASTENERTTVAYGTSHGTIVLRQIAGALAKRIVCYATKGEKVDQGTEMGFIKFGSRVDIYLPLDAEIMVAIGDKVEGNRTVIAKW